MPMTDRAEILRRSLTQTLARMDLEITYLVAMIATAVATGGLGWMLRGFA